MSTYAQSITSDAPWVAEAMKHGCDANASGSEVAVIEIAKELLTLRFCQHHADQYEANLIGAGWVSSKLAPVAPEPETPVAHRLAPAQSHWGL